MISLAPLKDKEKIDGFFNKSSLEPNESSGCVTAEDKNELLGYCLYDLDNEKIVIRYIEPLGDLGLADGILRSTLHVAAEKSIMKANYAETVPEELFEKLNFIKDKKEKALEIDKLFASCCNCNK